MRFAWCNGNPWQNTLPDCTVRNIALASNWGYRKICKELNAPCKDGYGLTRSSGAASVDKIISTFKKKLFDVVEADTSFFKKNDAFSNNDIGLTIKEQAALLPKGRYVFIIRPTSEMIRNGEDPLWHVTFVNLNNNTIYDTFDCSDNTFVYGYMRVDKNKILPKEDKDSLTEEIRLINGGYLWGDETPFCFSKKTWKEKIQPELQRRFQNNEYAPSLYIKMARDRCNPFRVAM